jgi:hypothetical protein
MNLAYLTSKNTLTKLGMCYRDNVSLSQDLRQFGNFIHRYYVVLNSKMR